MFGNGSGSVIVIVASASNDKVETMVEFSHLGLGEMEGVNVCLRMRINGMSIELGLLMLLMLLIVRIVIGMIVKECVGSSAETSRCN